MRQAKLWVLILLIFLLFPEGKAWAQKTLVFVSILPQKYFVHKIGGDLVDVQVMVMPGASPATYEPRPKQMVMLRQARAYFAIGVPFERVWLKKFAGLNPKLLIVHTDAGIEKRHMEQIEGILNSVSDNHQEHRVEHHHDRTGMKDPHIWLSPRLVKIQAENIFKGLVAVDPIHSAEYKRNFNRFCKSIEELEKKIKEILEPSKLNSRKFMVFHPSWGYFARDFGLKQVPIEVEGREPGVRVLQKLVQLAKREGIKVVFVQKQFSAKSAQVIAKAVGGQVVSLDPLAYDWEDNLLRVAKVLRRGLGTGD
ncbi:zinc ABC transporter substrate-binding protein [Desulfohalobiaceae bacterium Ax17]|uniref:metal ABC transporter solute-binding protein, Zn/Mn family n=1 Tax=Desulfovulcanus ferrireducens TaxID=2831190 RepID=UPI00207BB8F4|nr:zinc ABC transporter substrate-binding protein [Desulfovulcanus ferrireducens]MBT8764490.1 zinc ABC transporter substrate-binding protein [Desulfovulcanus ferrireducens]